MLLINSRRQVNNIALIVTKDRNGGQSPKYRPFLYKQEAKLSLG